MIWAFAAVVVAVPVALFLIRPRVAGRVEKDVQGIKTEHLIAPLVTLAVFLSAFVVAQATSSFQRANAEAGNEGGAVDQFFETAGLLPDGTGREIQAATVCYARAVGEQEWAAMESGGTAGDVGVWTDQIRGELPKVLEGPSPVVSQLLALDRLRSESRRLRLTEAVPSIPALVLTLMFVAVLGVVIALTTFALPAIRRRSLAAITLTVAVLLGSTLFLVEELEEPYTGVIRIESDAIARTASSGAEDFATLHPGVELPCDERGTPVVD